MDDGFWASARAWVHERTSSPVYVAFAISFIAWNWKLIYSLFFTNEEFLKTATRLEYSLGYSHAFYKLSIPVLSIGANFAALFVVPVIFTYLGIRWLPYVHVWAHKHHRKFHYMRKQEEDAQRNEYEQRKVESLENLRSAITRQADVSEDIVEQSERVKQAEVASNENLSDEEKNKRELDELVQDDQMIAAMKQAQDIVYKYKGNFQSDRTMLTYGDGFIDPAAVARLDTFGLVNTDSGKDKDKMEFTEKGKLLLQRLQMLQVL